jgi:CRP-like cAMP-binding protein
VIVPLQEPAWAARSRAIEAKQIIYSQGTPAFSLFYIREGGVRLTTRSKHQPSAVTAILRVGDFFGGLCLVGLPLHMSTAVALTASSIRVIKKESMIRMLQKKKLSNSFVSYLLSCIKKYQDHCSTTLSPRPAPKLYISALCVAAEAIPLHCHT